MYTTTKRNLNDTNQNHDDDALSEDVFFCRAGRAFPDFLNHSGLFS